MPGYCCGVLDREICGRVDSPTVSTPLHAVTRKLPAASNAPAASEREQQRCELYAMSFTLFALLAVLMVMVVLLLLAGNPCSSPRVSPYEDRRNQLREGWLRLATRREAL
jgi:hypothetical protein